MAVAEGSSHRIAHLLLALMRKLRSRAFEGSTEPPPKSPHDTRRGSASQNVTCPAATARKASAGTATSTPTLPGAATPAAAARTCSTASRQHTRAAPARPDDSAVDFCRTDVGAQEAPAAANAELKRSQPFTPESSSVRACAASLTVSSARWSASHTEALSSSFVLIVRTGLPQPEEHRSSTEGSGSSI